MGSPKTFKQIAGSEELNRVQDNIDTAFNPFLNSEIVDGILLTNIPLVTGVNEINHKLGRILQGWIPVGQSANANIWDSQATNIRKARTLILNSSANLTISLWVF